MNLAYPRPLRIGCLGAAHIAPTALVRPARHNSRVVVAAVAARDRSRADAFAVRHGIPKVYASYRELVDAPELDAVYVPLPNSLHAEWTLGALAAGKHVLCEKPFTANAAEAAYVAAAAAHSGRVVMEAFHWRYHPLADRMIEILESGELGRVRHIEAAFIFPLPRRSDIRWELSLAGGSLMDTGCYPVHMLRTLAGAEPRVRAAASKLRGAGVDRWIRAELSFEDGRTGRITAGMWAFPVLRLCVRVIGDRSVLTVVNPLAPQTYNRLTVRGQDFARRERIRTRPTYEYQLEAFVAAVQDGTPVLTGPEDSVANMRVIDAIYQAAGLEPRPGMVG